MTSMYKHFAVFHEDVWEDLNTYDEDIVGAVGIDAFFQDTLAPRTVRRIYGPLSERIKKVSTPTYSEFWYALYRHIRSHYANIYTPHILNDTKRVFGMPYRETILTLCVEITDSDLLDIDLEAKNTFTQLLAAFEEQKKIQEQPHDN